MSTGPRTRSSAEVARGGTGSATAIMTELFDAVAREDGGEAEADGHGGSGTGDGGGEGEGDGGGDGDGGGGDGSGSGGDGAGGGGDGGGTAGGGDGGGGGGGDDGVSYPIVTVTCGWWSYSPSAGLAPANGPCAKHSTYSGSAADSCTGTASPEDSSPPP